MQAAVDQKYITSLQIVAKHLFIKPLMFDLLGWRLYCMFRGRPLAPCDGKIGR